MSKSPVLDARSDILFFFIEGAGGTTYLYINRICTKLFEKGSLFNKYSFRIMVTCLSLLTIYFLAMDIMA